MLRRFHSSTAAVVLLRSSVVTSSHQQQKTLTNLTAATTNTTPLVTCSLRAQASFGPFASTKQPSSGSRTHTALPFQKELPRLKGVIKSWHFIERCGEIEAIDETNNNASQIFKIRNAQSFETIMPTSHRSLDGAPVTFSAMTEMDPENENAVVQCAIGIILEKTAANDNKSSTSATLSPKEIAERLEQKDEREKSIKPSWGITDLRAETLFAPGGFLSKGSSGPSYSGPKVGGALAKQERRDLGQGMVLEGNLVRVEPPQGLMLNGEVVAWSGIHRTGLVRVPDQKEDDGRDVQYAISNVDAFQSAMPSSIPLMGATVRFRPVHLHSVANADEVVARGGKSKLKLGAVVKSIAEGIQVVELPSQRKKREEEEQMAYERATGTGGSVEATSRLHHQDDVAVVQDDVENFAQNQARLGSKRAEQIKRQQERFRDWMKDDDEEAAAASAIPVGPQYGVITRWSGGQGVIEAGTGKVYRINSATDFATYFDVASVSVRGAVVEFKIDATKPKYASDIKILSDMVAAAETGAVAQTAIPLANLPFQLEVAEEGESFEIPSKQQQENINAAADSTSTETTASAAAAAPAPSSSSKSSKRYGGVDVSALPVRTGVLVSYSPAEFQGVIKDQETSERFLLRDVRNDTQFFPKIKKKLARGCVLDFRAVGSSGRLATFAELKFLANGDELPQMVDQDQLDVDENIKKKKKRPDGADQDDDEDDESKQYGSDMMPVDEAVAGPMSMTYWVARFEKVGANMNDFKQYKETATVPGEMPKDEKGEEIEDFRKNDPWFNDSEKNRKIPGTDARFSDLLSINQMGMMELSMAARSPDKLQKRIKEVEEKLSPEQREKGWQKAREWGPKYLRSIKEAKARGDDAANFNFNG